MTSRLLVIKGKRHPMVVLPVSPQHLMTGVLGVGVVKLPSMFVLWHPDAWSRYAEELRKQNPRALRGVRVLVIEL